MKTGTLIPTTLSNSQTIPIVDFVLGLLSKHLTVGSLTVQLPDQTVHTLNASPHAQPSATLRLNNRRGLRRLLTGGLDGFADAYIAGDWDSPSLTDLLCLGAANESALEASFGGRPLFQFIEKIRHRFNANSKRQARKNIAFHYDLGNDFYRHWLDETMTYSSAMFSENDESLADAQHRKYEHLASLLQLDDATSILEIGCGWGGFMEYISENHDTPISGVTISKAQWEFARKRLRHAQARNQTEVLFSDYRDVQGEYDRIASIEMFEAVGEAYWPVFANKLSSLLAPSGVAALQIITIDEQRFENYRRTPDFIQRYIFPGGMLPSYQKLEETLNGGGLKITKKVSFGKDYAKTLDIWRERFCEAWPELVELGFDNTFKRTWLYYLAYCEAGFLTDAIDVVQIRVEHA